MAATISIECVHCHKRYNAPATMAGKKVKCKHCGKVFAIPGDSTEQASSDPNLSNVGADAAAGTGAPLPGVANGGGKAGSRTGGKLGSASAGYASKMARSGDVEEIDFAKSSDGAMLRPTIPHDFPGAAALDGLAPVLMVALALGLLAWCAFGFTGATGVGWVGPVRLIAYLGLCTGLAFPLGYMAVRSAARKCRFMMPPGSAMRAMGTFAFPFALALWMWLSGETLGMLIFGTILGALIVSLAVWFLFRLQPSEYSAGLGGAGAAFVGSVVLSYGILFGINMVFETLAAKSDTNQLAASPMGAFAWDVKPSDGSKTVKKKVIVKVPETRESTTEATTREVVSIVKPENVGTNPTTAETNPPPPSTGPTIVRITTPQPPLTTAPSVPPPTTKNVVAGTDTHPNVVEPASPLVAKIAPVADLGDCDQIVFGGGNSNAVAAIKFGQNEESVTFFGGNPLVKKGEAKFDVEKNLKQQYFLSSTGTVMARMTSFPKLGVQLWDTNTNQEIRIVPLEDKALPAGAAAAAGNSPEMVGFGFDDRLVVLWPGFHPKFEVINSKAANAPRVIFQVANFDRTPSNPVISPDGRQVALEAVFENEAGVDLWDLTAARREPLRTCKPLRNDLKQPLGLAYGPMGVVAAYFEVAGKGIMYSFRASDGKPLHDENGFPYRTLPYPPGAPDTFTGRGLEYIDANTWLLMGRSLIDTESGKILGDLKIENAKAQRVVDKETVLIESQTPEGKMQLTQVKLKTDQIAARRAEVRKKGP